MQRVTRSTAVAVQPAPPASPGSPGFFTPGNPGGGVQATIPGYEWFNGVQEELIGVITRAGLAPSAADMAQLRQAMDRLYGGGVRFVTASTVLTASDAGIVIVDAAAGAITITLPAANAAGGRPMRLAVVRIDSSANGVVVSCAGGNTLDGLGATSVLGDHRLSLVSDGNLGWYQTSNLPRGDLDPRGWSAASTVPTGMIGTFAALNPPTGWIKTNGALLSRTTFAGLFAYAQSSGALVSEAAWFGGASGAFAVGDGATTFRVPDLRGEFVRVWDDSRGVDTGRTIGSLQSGALQSHNHPGTTASGGAHTHTGTTATSGAHTHQWGTNDNTGASGGGAVPDAAGGTTWQGNTDSAGAHNHTFTTDTGGAHTHSFTTDATGGAETRPRNLALLVCIKF